jgi:hypothetical protein
MKRVLDLMIEFIGHLYNLLQHFTNHYLRLDTHDFWPYYTNTLLLELFWLPNELKCQLLLASRYIASCRTTQKTHPLPRNGCPLLLRIRFRGMCSLSRWLAMDLCVTVPYNDAENHWPLRGEWKLTRLCKSWGFHSDDYEECRLLGCGVL